MPVTSPQGTLDFKKVDKITFVGASSNTVIDTTTGSVGIGVVGDALSSNLHVVGDTRMEGNINMLHTSNTASIKLNSNVVTEFPRSKKLMKFPRVALTSASDNAYENGYKVTVSNESGDHKGHDAFDGILGDQPGPSYSLWYSGGDGHYNDTDGAAVSTAPQLDTNTDRGDWLGIELPVAIKLQYFYLWQQPNDHQHFPKSGIVYAKKETNDSWVEIYRYDDRTRTDQPYTPEIFSDVNSEIAYKYFALVCTKRLSQATSAGVAIGEWQLFGVPEYDPEAHGTDVVVKSEANVPNTDWLEVYYEGKNYTNGNIVQDETENNIDGSFTGITYNTEYNSFDFNGVSSSSKITATLPSTFVGNQPFTVSVWFKRYNDSVDENTIWRIGPRTDEKCLALAVSGGNFNFFGNDSTDGTFSSTTFTNGGYVVGRWYHVACVYDGASRYIFIDSVRDGTTVTNSLNFDASTELVLGFNGINKYLNGSIANFRLFNRVLTSDEVWQLYSYQKEYFGHGDLSMTLKAGRLGIGTSEPRAALDVRGLARFKNVFFFARANLTGNFDSHTQNTLINDVLQRNGDLELSSDGRKVIVTSSDAAGVYMVFCQVTFRTTGTTDRGMWARLRKNGANFAMSNQAIVHITSSTYTQHVLSGLIDLDVGDEVHHYADGDTNIDVYTNATHFYMYRIST